MTATTPTLAPCERCRLTRPVWPYIPRHHGHLYDPATSECRWCGATEWGRPQPLLCVGCTQTEAAEESGRPAHGEAGVVNALRTPRIFKEER